jgi:hypothetical protein
MDFKEIVSVSKMSGLFLMAKKRNDGMIVKSLIDGKQTFAASRSHTFTPLENITIYTEDEPIELAKVFIEIKKQLSKNPLPDAKAEGAVLRNFFEKIVPTYDQERVYNSDIQKIVKWYSLLDEHGIIDTIQKEETAPAEEAAPAKEEKKAKKTSPKVEEVSAEEETPKPKAKKTKKKED